VDYQCGASRRSTAAYASFTDALKVTDDDCGL
jgi:hypothetical protein